MSSPNSNDNSNNQDNKDPDQQPYTPAVDSSRLFNLARQPCFKEASLTASAISITVGTIVWVRRRSVLRTMDFVAGSWVAGLIGSWWVCRRRRAARQAAIQDAVSRQANVVQTLPGDDNDGGG